VQPRGQSNRSRPEEDASARAGQAAVRVLPRELVAEAFNAARADGELEARLPRVVRPERLHHVGDTAPLLRMGYSVMLKLDLLDDPERRRALDVATGIACALDARLCVLDGEVDGIRLTPSSDRVAELPESAATESETAAPPASPPTTPEPARTVAAMPQALLCALCDQRAAAAEFDSPLEMILRRDGSRDWAPRVGVCHRCQQGVRHWRFAVAWCTQCERWGRRGVISPCGLVYGT